MKGRKIGIIVVILFIFVMAMIFVMMKLSDISSRSFLSKSRMDTEERVELLSQYDYMIYWIGECPEELQSSGANITVLAPENMNDSTMPVKWSSFHYTEYDEEGNLVKEVIPRDYPEKMLIVLNAGRALTEGEADVLNRCVVDNYIPLIVIGKPGIDDIRSRYLLVEKDYGFNDTMEFITGEGATDNTVSSEAVEKGGRDLTDEVLDRAIELFAIDLGPEPEVVGTVPSETSSEETEISETMMGTETEGSIS